MQNEGRQGNKKSNRTMHWNGRREDLIGSGQMTSWMVQTQTRPIHCIQLDYDRKRMRIVETND